MLPAKAVLRNGRLVRPRQRPQLTRQQLREPDEQRQLQLAVPEQVIDQLLEIHVPRVVLRGPDDDVPPGIDVKVTGRPVLDAINLLDALQGFVVHVRSDSESGN